MKTTLFALAFFSVTLPAFGQGVDPLIGTWKLNFEKSVPSPLKSATLIIAGEGQNRTLTANGVLTRGQPVGSVQQHVYDGVPHPTTGASDYDATAFARIGNTINVVRFKNGKPMEVGQAILVPDKTYTYTFDAELNGQVTHVVLVYERQ
jgi:hypothetical protein